MTANHHEKTTPSHTKEKLCLPKLKNIFYHNGILYEQETTTKMRNKLKLTTDLTT